MGIVIDYVRKGDDPPLTSRRFWLARSPGLQRSQRCHDRKEHSLGGLGAAQAERPPPTIQGLKARPIPPTHLSRVAKTGPQPHPLFSLFPNHGENFRINQ